MYKKKCIKSNNLSNNLSQNLGNQRGVLNNFERSIMNSLEYYHAIGTFLSDKRQ